MRMLAWRAQTKKNIEQIAATDRHQHHKHEPTARPAAPAVGLHVRIQNMKTFTLTLVLALLCACNQRTDAESTETKISNSDSAPVRNLKYAWDGSGKQLIKLSDDEKQKLNAAGHVLEKLAASPRYKKLFWSSISDRMGVDPPKPITWAEAEKRIRKGEFRIIDQAHDKRLRMQTSNYEEFITTQERIDQAYAIIKEIDPKGVFIDYGTE